MTLPPLFEALRPRQWTKNLLVFAGLLFAAKLGDADRWAEATGTFVAFCAASSAAYLLNDLRDVDQDRTHPVKRTRPIARGSVTERAATTAAAVLTVAALVLGLVVGLAALGCVALFLVTQTAYSYRMKHVPILDVMTIGGLFVIRAVAGAAAVHVRISPWLLLCAGLLALFLGFAKRRAELVLVGANATPGRPVLDGYSLQLVDQLVAVVAASTVISYALYTFTARTSKAMMITSPFVIYGVLRYLMLIQRDDLGEEPENILLKDKPILVTVVLWALTAVIVLKTS